MTQITPPREGAPLALARLSQAQIERTARRTVRWLGVGRPTPTALSSVAA